MSFLTFISGNKPFNALSMKKQKKVGKKFLLAIVNKNNEEVDNLLQKHEDIVVARDIDGNNCIHIVARTGSQITLGKLIRAGADEDAVNTKGERPTHVAIVAKQPLIVQTLLFEGVNPRAEDNKGTSLFLCAIKHADTETALLLATTYKVDIDKPDKAGWTPLMWAIRRGEENLFDFLVASQANPLLKNKAGSVAYLIAAEFGRHLIMAKLKNIADKEWEKSDLNTDMETEIVLCNSVVQTAQAMYDRQGNTAVILAARHGHLSAVAHEIENHANLNHRNDAGMSALMETARWGKSEVTLHLMDSKVINIDATNNLGHTAYQIAIRYGQEEVRDALLSIGVCQGTQEDREASLMFCRNREARKLLPQKSVQFVPYEHCTA